MDQTQGTPPIRSHWYESHKRQLLVGLGCLFIIICLLFAGLYFKLNRFLANQVVDALGEYGLRTEIGNLDLDWRRWTAILSNIKIYNQQTGQLIATVEQAEMLVQIPDPFALRLSREIIFKRLGLNNVNLLLDVDEQGRSNIQGLHPPPPSPPGWITLDFSSLNGVLKNGRLEINDRARGIEGELGNLQADAQPLPGGTKVAGQLTTGGGRFRYQGREMSIDGLELRGNAGETGAEIDIFTLHSSLGQASAKGRIDDWKALRYSFGLQASAVLNEIARVLESRAELQGRAGFDGRVEGDGARFRITGALESDDFTAAGARVRGTTIQGISIESNGSKTSFAGQEARVQDVTVQGTRVTNVAAGSISGEFSDRRISSEVSQVSIARIEIVQGQGQVSGVMLKNINAVVDQDRYRARGHLLVKNGTVRKASLGPLKGELVAENNTIALNRFNASLFGGSAAGDAAVQLGETGRGFNSRLKANVTGVKTVDILTLFSTSPAPLAGTIDGNVDLSWPGTDLLAANGKITARLSADTTQTPEAIPVKGEVEITARSGIFDINQFTLNTDASKLTATGKLSREGDSDLRLSLNSTSAEQLQTIAYSIDEVRKALEDYEPQITGELKIEGQITGTLKDPTIEGSLKAASISLHDELLGSLSGQLLLSPTEVRFDNGLLTATNNGTLKFNYLAPRDKLATEGHLDATLDRISVDSMIAAAGLPVGQRLISGEVSGEAHLTALPANPQGTLTLNLINGVISGQTTEMAIVNLVLDGQTARLDRAEVRLPQGHILANGSLDLKTNIFQLQGKAESVDVRSFFDSLEVENLQITGIADATLQASGNIKEFEQLKVELTAQGKDITINGQSTGPLTLNMRTSQNGRIDLDLTTGITGKPQLLRASIELRRPGRPIEVESDLTDFDLGPLVAAFAPDLARSIDGVVSGKLHLEGPTVNAREELSFDQLHGNLILTSISLQFAGRDINVATPFRVKLDGPQVTLEQTRVFGEGLDLSLGGTFALAESARMNFAVNGSANLDALNEFTTDYYFSGTLAINARIEGTVNEPVFAGEVGLNRLSMISFNPRFNIDEGNGRILLSGDKVTLESFSARANDGKISANGTLTLAQFQPKEWQFDFQGSEILVFYQGMQLILDGDLNLAGNRQGQLLSGKITIPQAEYTTDFDIENLADTGKGGIAPGIGGGRRGRRFGLAPLNLDLRVEANESIFVHNEQVSTVGSALITVGGRANEPRITGRMTLEGGTIRFRSQRYEITTGTIDFPIGTEISPEVNLTAEGDVSGYHVIVSVNGPLNDMDLELRSEPYLSRSEVLSLITRGRTDSDVLGSEDLTRSGIGLAASLLTQEFISKPTESILGISRFQIDPVLSPNNNPAARLTIGQQIRRDLMFTYSTNLASEQDQTIILDYTLSNRFSIVTSFTQGGTSAQSGSNDNGFAIEFRGRRRYALGYLGSGTIGTGPGRPPAPAPRPRRTDLPPAEVSVEKPEGVRLSDRKLRELLPVMKSGFSLPLTRLGERNLTNYLQEQGYFFAKVSHRCEPADCSGPNPRVIYDVEPGYRLALGKIRIEGTNKISLGDVRGDLQSQTASIFGRIPFLRRLPLIGGYARGITSNERLQNDREVIRRRLVNQGFRYAKIDSRLATSTDSGDLIVIFDVNEGPRTIIAEIAIRGNTVITASLLREKVPIKDDDPFSITKIREGTKNIRTFYQDSGYLEATTELDIEDLPDDRVRIVYQVTEGNRSVASEVLITGQTKTHENSIRRFLDITPGETLTPTLIRRTQRDLYSTGAFSEVNINTELVGSGDETARRVTVGVTEAKPLLFVYGTGYSTDDGPRGLIQLSNTNLFGRVNTASLRLRVSGREQLGQISYTDLRPFNSRWATTVSAYYDRNTDLQSITRQVIVDGEVQDGPTLSYGINRFVAFIQTERKLSEITSVRLRYSYQDSRLSNINNIPLNEIGRNNQPINLGFISAGMTHDTRDSGLNPTRGQLFSGDYSLASRIFGGNEAYNKFFGNYQVYRTFARSTPVLRDSTLVGAARIGLAKPFNVTLTGSFDDKLLPISERFFAGGATTLRGFRFEQAGPQVVIEPRLPNELPALVAVGGNASTIFNFELRYPLTRRLRLVPFYDLGNVFALVSDISFSGMTNSVGLGLRINTPIGPIGIDYGYLIDPPSFVTASGAVLRQPRGAFHIQFGQTF